MEAATECGRDWKKTALGEEDLIARSGFRKELVQLEALSRGLLGDIA